WRHSAIPRDTAIRTKGTGVRGRLQSIMGEFIRHHILRAPDSTMPASSNIQFTGNDGYLQAAMSGLAARQRAIANNVANIDTPNFKASEVRFEDALTSALRRDSASTQDQA